MLGGLCARCDLRKAISGIWRCLTALVITMGALILVPAAGTSWAATSPPPEVASYTIWASYDPATHSISGTQTATYVNRTDSAISDLVFHLYLNAFSHADTLWMREAGSGHRGYQADEDSPGWIRIGDIRLSDGTALNLDAVDRDETLVRADLPAPVEPGADVTVEMAFTAQLPKVFARTGWADNGDFVMAGQWFPKFGVWESGAWNAYPFHANSEFYADFGTYDVTLTLPQGWVVGTTGVADGEPTEATDGTATQRFLAEHVIDFAWGASPNFRARSEKVNGVRVEVLFYPDARGAARRVAKAVRDTIGLYGDWYGPYGGGLYPELTVIMVPEDAGGAGGMEYPSLFTVGATASLSGPACVRLLEIEAVHELAHQWFQSVIATNEAEEPWLDEGFADYSTSRAFDVLFGGAVSSCGGWSLSYVGNSRLGYVMYPNTQMSGTAWSFEGDYAIATYAKPALALTTLQRRVGEAAMVEFLGTYAQRYAFAHPTAEDLRAVMAETLGEETAAWFFDSLVESDATLDARVHYTESDRFELEREGRLCVPVTLRFVEGKQAEEVLWTCDEPLTVDLDDATAVMIDPSQTALLDLDLANNGLRRAPDWESWLGFVVRTVRVLQILFGGGG